MTPAEQMKAVEDRAFNARLTMGEVLKIAGVAHSTWSRGKARGYVRPRTLAKVEGAMKYFEDVAARQAEAA